MGASPLVELTRFEAVSNPRHAAPAQPGRCSRMRDSPVRRQPARVELVKAQRTQFSESIMKGLYARFVLWLIRPALEVNGNAGQAATTQSLHLAMDAAKNAAKEEIRQSMMRGGPFCQVHANRERLIQAVLAKDAQVRPQQEAADRGDRA